MVCPIVGLGLIACSLRVLVPTNFTLLFCWPLCIRSMGIRQDEFITALLLGESHPNVAPLPRGALSLTSSYLALPPRFERALVTNMPAAGTHLICSSPQARFTTAGHLIRFLDFALGRRFFHLALCVICFPGVVCRPMVGMGPRALAVGCRHCTPQWRAIWSIACPTPSVSASTLALAGRTMAKGCGSTRLHRTMLTAMTTTDTNAQAPF